MTSWLIISVAVFIAGQPVRAVERSTDTPAGVEIDFIWSRGDSVVAIEVKSAVRWQREFSSALQRALQAGMVSRAFGVHLGGQALRVGQVQVFPLQEFLKRLWAGDVLRSAED